MQKSSLNVFCPGNSKQSSFTESYPMQCYIHRLNGFSLYNLPTFAAQERDGRFGQLCLMMVCSSFFSFFVAITDQTSQKERVCLLKEKTLRARLLSRRMFIHC